MPASAPSPSILFRDSLEEVDQLLAMHVALTGTRPGRRHNVAILNKSAVIFACAAFEAFIETLADSAFEHLIANAADHTALPKVVRQTIADTLKSDPHELRIWDLAGNGWKQVAEKYKSGLIRKYVGPFNTPKPNNIKDLLNRLIGLEDITTALAWPRMSQARAAATLVQFVELRGSLAHGNNPTHPVTKRLVMGYLSFLAAVSVRASNTVRSHCHHVTGTFLGQRRGSETFNDL